MSYTLQACSGARGQRGDGHRKAEQDAREACECVSVCVNTMLRGPAPSCGVASANSVGARPTTSGAARYASLYTQLLRANEADVDLHKVAEHFGYHMRMDLDNEANSDPNYVGLVNAEMDRGVASFVASLELTCSSLAGLAPSQTSPLVQDDILRARAHCIHQIVRVLTDPDATQALLVAKVQEIDTRLSVAAVDRYRQETKMAMRGVQALASVASAACMNHEFAATAQNNFACLTEVCARPPRCLVEQLRDEGLNMGVVTACIIGSRPGLHTHGVSGLQPSWGRQLDMLTHYFESNSGVTAERFRSACVATLNVLHVELVRSNTAFEWCGCCLVAADSPQVTAARLAPNVDRVFPMPVPSHTSSPNEYMIVATDGKPEALRVVRFARMLRVAVEAGCLRVGTVRSDILLMAVARARIDVERAEWETASFADKQRVMERLLNERRAFDAQVPCVVICNGAAAATASGACTPLLARAPPKTATSGVPLELQRDYHTLQALLRLMPTGRGTVAMPTLSAAMRAKGAYMESYSRHSACSRIGVAVSKAILSAKKHLPCSSNDVAVGDEPCEIVYLTSATGHKAGSEVQLNSAGAAHLAGHLRWILARMETGDVEYLRAWYTSKSARAKAKRHATQQLMEEESRWSEQ